MVDFSVIGRNGPMFDFDMSNNEALINATLLGCRILVVGAAGSIGKAVSREIFVRGPKTLHLVDISENNLVELVREIRSTDGYKTDDFRTFCVDVNSVEFDALIESEDPYDIIFNLSAMKHVRSERDPFTLMRMVQTNILNSIKLQNICSRTKNTKYFCVSSDKAANPVNLMGLTKRIMEIFAFDNLDMCDVSMARFANVAFSDGSLLHGFTQRVQSKHPITAPYDIKRYFITPKEAGELCLIAAITGHNGEIFFPSKEAELNAISFSDIAERYLRSIGYEPYICATEDEARQYFPAGKQDGLKYPCYFFSSDTTGEKPLEEFYSSTEELDVTRFKSIGVVKPTFSIQPSKLNEFLLAIEKIRSKGSWSKVDILRALEALMPGSTYVDNGKYLDGKM